MSLGGGGAPLGDVGRPADYTVMVNRFKLLNLVQQLAHQDVVEMIEAVGLDALSYKSTMDKFPAWMHGGGRRGRFSALWDGDRDSDTDGSETGVASRGGRGRRFSPAGAGVSRGNSGPLWRMNSRRVSGSGSLEAGDGANGAAARRRRKGTAFHTEEERDQYFSRLANPRSRARVIDGDVPLEMKAGRGQGRQSLSSGGLHNATDPSSSPSGPTTTAAAAMHRRQISFDEDRGDGGGGYGPVASSSFLAQDSVVAAGVGADGQRSLPFPGAASSILNPSGSVFQSRSGRGLAPKVKPKGAAVDQQAVPISVIRQAARTIRSSGAGGAQAPSPDPEGGDADRLAGGGGAGSVSGSAHRRRRGEREEDADQPDSTTADNSLLQGPKRLESGVECALTGSIPQTADEMVALVESMLDAQERALQEVIGDIDLSGARATAAPPPPPPPGAARVDSATNTTGGAGMPHHQWEMEYLEDALLKDSDEEGTEELDDLLVLSRMERRLQAMEEELERVHGTEAPETEATTPEGGLPASAPRRSKPRGEMPEAMRKRLLTARKEAFEYIAYNERQWNTSQVSQFTFAQRLTNALAEDGFAEVLEEVLTIMDDYVEGLADHELQ